MTRLTLFLALVWLALTGDTSPANLVFAIGLSILVLALARPLGPPPVFTRVRLLPALRFVIFAAAEIILANIRVAIAVLGPQRLLRPAVVALPLDLTRDDEIVLLAALINLTPGTLSLDVSPDRRTLYVHAMFARDPDRLRRDIKDGFERRIREVVQ